MRAVLLSLAMLLALAAARPAPAATIHQALQPALSASTTTLALQNATPPKIDITIEHAGRPWYRSPVWIAIGVLALVVLILIVAMIARGGGTTIIKE